MKRNLFQVEDRSTGHTYGLYCQRADAERRLSDIIRWGASRPLNLTIREI